ncbi:MULTISPECIES: LytTR family DNA-binding domain-containing protein [unclassified Bacteroides]|jgi:DNA-binding LytR/AlgR family response regulator|uniref:LytR/AlgR family response regulator transcription factor n=1 Tax=unclassified Bacteroides TaxID=2646097 RepID=UPI000E8FD7D9|nr:MULTISPECIES: LytTR family DNA-binding domain-containing protein [unclassified Bacteroides]RGN47663.1 DNA-binding response regulator [Bacteroides sp. OM05-12]RHR75317.1 DNA-binding response regulator [Bacteroides sp. AF16-49]
MKSLIIEDEKAAVRNLTAILTDVAPEIEIIGAPDSVADAIEWFASNPMPELVFMDIHLADGSAFEIFEHIQIKCPVIFTTAYDEYALRAFKVNSIDYLLKPINEQDVRAALTKLKNLYAVPSSTLDLQQLLYQLKHEESYKTYFLVPTKGDKLIPLSIKEIAYFYITEGSVKVVTNESREYILPRTLDELTDSLNPTIFFRANRQFLISRDAIKDIDLWFNNRLAINLYISTPEKIVISKARAGEFKDWFAGGR